MLASCAAAGSTGFVAVNKWPSSKTEMAENPNATLPFVSEICTMMGQPFSKMARLTI